MKKQLVFISLAALFTLGGCATMLAPSRESLGSLPVVKFGDAVPADKEFILYFPAGKPIPTHVSIKGTLFAQEADQTLNVTLRKDVYTYKHWISFDRTNWLKGDDAIASNLEIKIPSYDHPQPGIIKIQMDIKK